jgi:tRNA(fMet)-specific endonuclease VapC
MNFLLDTNILLILSKNRSSAFLDSIIDNEDNRIYLSIVTLAEIKSIGFRNNWGKEKWDIQDAILKRFAIMEVNESLLETYVQIDAYSQRRNSSFHDYDYGFATPRNMGKNDLWIASTAALLGLTLVTTDKDFDHLHQVFMEVKRITPETLV